MQQHNYQHHTQPLQEQKEKVIALLTLLFVVFQALILLIYFIKYWLDLDYSIIKYINLITGVIGFGPWIIALLIGLNTKMKKFKGWIIALSCVMLAIRSFWLGRSFFYVFFEEGWY